MPKIIATLTPSGYLGHYRVRCLDPTCFRATPRERIEEFGEAEKLAAWHAREYEHVTVIEDMEAEDD